MSQITLDHEFLEQTCDQCQKLFIVSRGSVYEDGEGIGIYLASMHACDSSRLVNLAIALREGYQSSQDTAAFTLKVRPTEGSFQMAVTDPRESHWRTETDLGRVLSRKEALASSLIEACFHIADHIVMEIPEIYGYLADSAP